MSDFIKKLDKVFVETKERDSTCESKLAFVGSYIFDFTTYDSEMDELFAQKMLEVIECILKGNALDYQKSSQKQYENYLLMVNMPFLQNKIDWGTSIRGAWFVIQGGTIQISPEFGNIRRSEIKLFMESLIEWVYKIS